MHTPLHLSYQATLTLNLTHKLKAAARRPSAGMTPLLAVAIAGCSDGLDIPARATSSATTSPTATDPTPPPPPSGNSTASDFSVSDINIPQTVSFTANDFNTGFSDPDGDTFSGIEIVAVQGTLQLSGSNVAAGDQIAEGELANLTYHFTPEQATAMRPGLNSVSIRATAAKRLTSARPAIR